MSRLAATNWPRVEPQVEQAPPVVEPRAEAAAGPEPASSGYPAYA